MTPEQKQRLLSIVTEHAPDLFDTVAALAVTEQAEMRTRDARMIINELRRGRTGAYNPLTLTEDVRRIIDNSGIPQYRPEQVMSAVVTATGIPADLIQSPSRLRAITDARHLAVALMAHHCLIMPMTEIGRIFNRNHATSLYSVRVAAELENYEPIFRVMTERAKQELTKIKPITKHQ